MELLNRLLEEGDTSMHKIALFIPVYNEEETLANILSMIPSVIHGYKTEIFIVDDCSQDNSKELARAFTPWVISLEKHRGVGHATKKGLQSIIQNGGFEFIIKFDADGQHRLNFLSEITECLIEGYDLVICSRFHRLSDQTHTPMDRILLNTLFTEAVKKITGWRLTDARSGYMGFPVKLVEKIAPKLVVPHYGIPMEIILRIWAEDHHATLFEIPHPALYNGDISAKIRKKYSEETLSDRSDRVRMNFDALLLVIKDMGISKDFLHKSPGLGRALLEVANGIPHIEENF